MKPAANIAKPAIILAIPAALPDRVRESEGGESVIKK